MLLRELFSIEILAWLYEGGLSTEKDYAFSFYFIDFILFLGSDLAKL